MTSTASINHSLKAIYRSGLGTATLACLSGRTQQLPTLEDPGRGVGEMTAFL